jgi:A/G-specific adenine glycosylase
LDISPSHIQIADTKLVMEGEKYQWFSQQNAMAQGLPAPVRSILEQLNN